MQTESTPSESSIPPEAHVLLSQYLTLVDGALKRYAVDGYNSQLAIARNYMWLSFITLSGYAALFDRCGLVVMLRDYVLADKGGIFCLLAPLFLLKASYLSIKVLLTAIKACTGTNFTEAYEGIESNFTTLEQDGFTPADMYALKRQTLCDLYESLTEALGQADARGKCLRSMATDIRHSIFWALAGLLLFCFIFL